MRTKRKNSPKKGKKIKRNNKSKKKLASSKKKQVQKRGKSQNGIKKSNYSYSLKKYQSLPLREKMLEKLKSSRFRFMNEQLYNMRGKDALKYFQEDKEAFTVYHEGYKQQVQSWPKNPVDEIIKSLTALCSSNKNLVIGDFGCGEAKIAKSLPHVKVHSFDLVSLDPCVTVCDMASTPLENESLDVAVFCLSLMGTNFTDYLIEANRVLKIGGILKVAEIESRFDKVEKFIQSMIKFGFEIKTKNFSCKLFYFMDFKKERVLGKNFKKKAPQLYLKPCLYKKSSLFTSKIIMLIERETSILHLIQNMGSNFAKEELIILQIETNAVLLQCPAVMPKGSLEGLYHPWT